MKPCYSVFMLFLLFAMNVNGQDSSFSVKMENAGTLRKCIKKKEQPFVEKLKITGEINSEDIYFITTLPHIKILDLSDVTLQPKDEKAKANKGKFVTTCDVLIYDRNNSKNKTCEILNIPTNTTIEELIINQSMLIAADELHLKKLTLTLTDGGYENGFFFSSKDEVQSFFSNLRKNFSVDTIQIEQSFTDKYDCEFITKITSDGYLPNKYFVLFYPIFPKYHKMLLNGSYKTMLSHWDDSMELTVLAEVDSISPYAFVDSKLTTLKLPEQMKRVPEYCFYSWTSLENVDLNNVTEICDNAFYKCENLKTVKADNVRIIGDSAFYQNRSLTSITLKNVEEIASKALYGTSIDELVIPPTIKRISKDAFEGSDIKHIEFLGNTPPVIYKYSFRYNYGNKYVDGTPSCSSFYDLPQSFWKINYTIPSGAAFNFDKGLWYEFKMVEKDCDKPIEYELVVSEPGEIKKYLTDDILAYAETLKIRGVLYHEDILALDMCKHLRVLDLTEAFTMLNEKDRKGKAREEAYVMTALLAALGGMADVAEYGYLDTMKFVKNTVSTYNDLYNTIQKAHPDCTIPEIDSHFTTNNGNVPYFKYLEELKYPVLLNSIRRFGRYVKEVDLPRYATSISSLSSQQSYILLPDSLKRVDGYAFSDCPNIQEIIFPSSLERCSGYAFQGMVSLKKIDLSKTKIRKLYCDSYKSNYRSDPDGLPNLEEIYFPESLGILFGINNILGEKPVKIYFKSKSIPEGFQCNSVRGMDTVYIPKGCRSGWMEFISNTEANIVEW